MENGFWFKKRYLKSLMANETLLADDLTSWVDTLQWRPNGRDSVSNHQPHDCLLNRLWRRSKKTSKLRVTGLCAENSPGTGEFPAQMASYTENVSIWWRHHGSPIDRVMTNFGSHSKCRDISRDLAGHFEWRHLHERWYTTSEFFLTGVCGSGFRSDTLD